MTNNADITNLVEQWVRPEIRGLSAYKVADAAGLLKLDAMENPFGLPDSIKTESGDLLRQVPVNRYPDPHGKEIKQALRTLYGLPTHIEMLFGNGSDEIIQILAMTLGGSGRTILAVEPSFVMYKMVAGFTGCDYSGVPLTEDFQIDLEATLKAIQETRPAIVFVAQPNNPTGNLFDEEAIREIIRRAPGVVVVDEAYTAFTDADCLPWLQEFDNLLVMRTFSKVGLAGLRFGMLFGRAEWLQELDKVRLPYNINSLTQSVVAASLAQFDTLLQQTELLRKERSFLIQNLRRLQTLKVYPSEANFVLVKLPHGARKFFENLRERGVLIKLLDGGHPLLAECIRITVSTREENLALLEAFMAACTELDIH